MKEREVIRSIAKPLGGLLAIEHAMVEVEVIETDT